MASAHVYLLRCRDGSLYCGWTTDPHAREATHNAGKGAAYTRSRRPVRLVYLETLPDRSAALRRECAIKRLTRIEKLQLVAMSPKIRRPPPQPFPRRKQPGARAARTPLPAMARPRPEPFPAPSSPGDHPPTQGTARRRRRRTAST